MERCRQGWRPAIRGDKLLKGADRHERVHWPCALVSWRPHSCRSKFRNRGSQTGRRPPKHSPKYYYYVFNTKPLRGILNAPVATTHFLSTPKSIQLSTLNVKYIQTPRSLIVQDLTVILLYYTQDGTSSDTFSSKRQIW